MKIMERLNGLQIYLILVLALVYGFAFTSFLSDAYYVINQGNLLGITIFMSAAIYLAKGS